MLLMCSVVGNPQVSSERNVLARRKSLLPRPVKARPRVSVRLLLRACLTRKR